MKRKPWNEMTTSEKIGGITVARRQGEKTICGILFFLGVLALLSSCTTALQNVEPASYGLPISRELAQAQAQAWLQRNLKDFESARIRYGIPEEGEVRASGMYERTHYGYKFGVMVNAKNSFGGYTGEQPYLFLFQNQRLAGVYGLQRSGYGLRKID